MKPRKIAVLSEARATYGYVKRVMHLIEQSERLELQLIVTGMHLLKEYGSSINEIVRDGFTPAARVDMYVGGDTPTAWSKSLGVEMQGLAQVFDMLDPARVVAVRRGVVVGELEPKLSRFELHGLGLFVGLDGPVAGEPGARRVARSLVRTRGQEVGLRRTLREIPFGGHFVRPDLRHRRATHALYTRLEQRQLVFELPEERHGELPVVSLERGARACEPDDGGVSFVRRKASGVGLDVLPTRAAYVVVEDLARGTGLGRVVRGGIAGENVGVQARPRARGHGARAGEGCTRA